MQARCLPRSRRRSVYRREVDPVGHDDQPRAIADVGHLLEQRLLHGRAADLDEDARRSPIGRPWPSGRHRSERRRLTMIRDALAEPRGLDGHRAAPVEPGDIAPPHQIGDPLRPPVGLDGAVRLSVARGRGTSPGALVELGLESLLHELAELGQHSVFAGAARKKATLGRLLRITSSIGVSTSCSGHSRQERSSTSMAWPFCPDPAASWRSGSEPRCSECPSAPCCRTARSASTARPPAR